MRFRRDCHKSNLEYGPVTVSKMYESYINVALNKGNAPSSIRKAENMFQNHVLPFYKDHDIRHVSIEDHENLMTSLREEGLKPATINRVRSLLATMYSIAVRKRRFGGVFKFNPFDAIEPMKEIPKKIQYWDKESVELFLNNEESSYYYPLWILMINTGMRIGEAVAVHGEQIDTHEGMVIVDRQWCCTTKTFRETKGVNIRYLALSKHVQEIIYPMIKDGPIFTKPDGTRLTSHYVATKVLPRACKKAQVTHIGCHGFRHTYGAHYMMDGGSLWDLQKILGHSSQKTTNQHYTHFSRKHIHKRAQVVSFGNKNNVIEVNFNKEMVG